MKESVAFKVMSEIGVSILNHDDKLLLRGVKTRPTERGRKGGVGLEDEYWMIVPKAVDGNGCEVVTGYWNKLTGESHGVDWLVEERNRERFESEEGWTETFKRRLELAKGVWVETSGNQFDLIIANLYDDLRERYRIALDHFVDLCGRGIIKYQPKTLNQSFRNVREALRNRLKRELKPTEYEHNILFEGELGKSIFEELGARAKHREENTVYLCGFKAYDGLKRRVKFYDLGAREGLGQGRCFKLETTLLKAFFKAEGVRVNNLLEQPDIQERFVQYIAKELEIILGMLGGDTMRKLQEELGLENAGVQIVAREILARPRTLTEQVAEHDRRIAELEKRVTKLEQERQKR